MKKKRFILNLIALLVMVVSCKKGNVDIPSDVPDYKPGKLTEISHETDESGLTYHKYEYKENEITDHYYFRASEDFISKYCFNIDKLEKVCYSLENSNEIFLTDSSVYMYSDTMILEVNHYNGNSCDTNVYYLENGKIISSTNKPESLSTEVRTDRYYSWSGDNLIQYIEHNWIQGICFEMNCVFQYSATENPLFDCNIPKFINVFIPPQGGRYYELTDLVPKCSKNLPLKITIYYNYIPEVTDIYTFESRNFQNENKPYKVKIIHNQYFTDEYTYFLTYEKL